jgi:serine O-acetyltransferase
MVSRVVPGINQTANSFEHGASPRIQPGVVFHHTGVCSTTGTVIESDVHIYRNVTVGEKNGGAPHVKRHARIASHLVLVGAVVVGERAIVAPGAVVVDNVPNGAVVGGVPARVIGTVTDENYDF